MAYGNGGGVPLGGSPVQSGQYNGPSAPTERGNVGAMLEENQKRLTVLHSILDMLEQRLSPVLAVVPTNGVDSGMQAPSFSAVVNALKQSGFGIDAASSRLQSILDRLEL